MKARPGLTLRRIHPPVRLLPAVLLAALLIGSAGCRSAAPLPPETLGRDKRAQLTQGVAAVRASQQEAVAQFERTVEAFAAGRGEDAFDESVDRTADVRRQIETLEYLAQALFAAWAEEIELSNDQRLRAAGERSLAETRRLYEPLVETMRDAEREMDAALDAFERRLRARTEDAGAPAPDEAGLRDVVDEAVDRLEESAAEAGRFIRNLDAAD